MDGYLRHAMYLKRSIGSFRGLYLPHIENGERASVSCLYYLLAYMILALGTALGTLAHFCLG